VSSHGSMTTVYLLRVALVVEGSICTEGQESPVRMCPTSQDQLVDVCHTSGLEVQCYKQVTLSSMVSGSTKQSRGAPCSTGMAACNGIGL